jgi:uncharacterized protein (DUF1501 family)
MPASRRDLLASIVGTPAFLSLASAAPAFLARAARAAAVEDRRETVLVVVQLTGGNDGLNTVVPHEDDAYGRSRTTLRLAAADVLPIAAGLGFHPALRGFARLLKEGRLSIVQGVGDPTSDRNHPTALRNWHTAEPGRKGCPTGWLGRAIDEAGEGDASRAPGLFVGSIDRPFALAARTSVVPCVRSAADLTLHAAPGSPGGGEWAPSTASGLGAGANPLEAQARRADLAARATSRHVKAVLAGARGASGYPAHGFAADLKTVAELIRADVGIRIFLVELGGGGIGGFDNHADQRDNHAALLKQLSDAVAAFADDLARHGCLDRVVLATFSEFGRTLAENGRRGTGHGVAAPMFLVGGRVRAGLIGKHPSLTDLDGDAPRMAIDFRRVYAALLEQWLGLKSEPVLGATFEPLELGFRRDS